VYSYPQGNQLLGENMNYAVKINVWGTTTIYVTASDEEDAINLAEESINYNDIQYDYEVIDIEKDGEEIEWE
jgi:hypothetical protein